MGRVALPVCNDKDANAAVIARERSDRQEADRVGVTITTLKRPSKRAILFDAAAVAAATKLVRSFASVRLDWPKRILVSMLEASKLLLPQRAKRMFRARTHIRCALVAMFQSLFLAGSSTIQRSRFFITVCGFATKL